MILVAGGTGTLGSLVVERLVRRDTPVRVLTRDAARAGQLDPDLVDVQVGDVRDRAAVERAMAGVDTVVSAIQGFAGIDAQGPASVDHQGNTELIRAAASAPVGRFVLVSVHGAGPDHPMELCRMKHRAERELMASGLGYTIIRPTAFMETWIRTVGDPIERTGRPVVFGRGRNPITFVAAHDVAALVVLATTAPALRDREIDIGGPDDLTLDEFAHLLLRAKGSDGSVRHVPRPLMRAMAVLLKPIRPTAAGLVRAGVVMDTTDQTFGPDRVRAELPEIPMTRLVDLLPARSPTAT